MLLIMSRFFHFSKTIFLLLAGITAPVAALAQMSFPAPPAAPQRLFYVQRDPNANTIVYDANTISNGRAFNVKQPIRVYWIKYAENGQIEPLNYLQRTLAYGVDVRPVAGKTTEYEFNVVSYSKRKLRLFIDEAGRPHAVLHINGKQAWLDRVYVKITGKKAGLVPNVKYVELFGTDPKTGSAVYEKFVP